VTRLLSFSPRHPWWALLFLAILTGAAVLQLDHLTLRIRSEAMMVENAEERRFYDYVVDRFGSDNTVVIFLSDRDLFNAEHLIAIRRAIDALEALPFTLGTESLFSVEGIRNEDGFISAQPYLSGNPPTPEASAQAVRAALQNPLVAGHLISPEGKAMAISVQLVPDSRDVGFDEAAVTAIEQAIAPLAARLDTAFQLGAPYFRQTLTEQIRIDQARIMPLALLLLLVTVGVALRSIHAGLVPLLTAALSVVWTLGFMAAVDVPINVLTSVIPALLIIIGSTEDIHMLAEYRAGLRSGMRRPRAVKAMGVKLGTALLLTFLTTYVGFLSIAINDISMLRQFGLVASTGLFFNFLSTVLIVPMYLRYLGPALRLPGQPTTPLRYQPTADRLVSFLCRHQHAFLWSLVPLVVAFGYGATLLHVDNDPMDYFGGDAPLVQRAELLHEKLAGVESFSIVLRSGIEGTFLKVRYLEELRKLQDYLDRTGAFDKSSSFADFISLVNRVMDDDEDRLRLPDSDDVVREYMLFIKHRDVRKYVSEDFSEARVVVRHNITSSERLSTALRAIESFAREEIDPGLEVRVTGESVLTARAADAMARGQAESLLLMLVVIVLFLSMLFVNLKAGLLASVPNLLAIVVLFGLMGYAGIPLDSGTAMVAAIALGVSVDDTVHFMARYHQNTRKHALENRALCETVREEATPIVATSLALSLGFAVLAASAFPPVVYFGLLSAMVILVALAATLILTPLLLSSVRLITVWDMLSLRLRSKVIDKCELFRGLRPRQIKKVILVSDVRNYAASEAIVRQGAKEREMYVLLEGKADVFRRQGDGSTEKLRQLSTGDVFGEIGLMGATGRTADVIAAEPVSTLVVEWNSIDRVARYFPRIASHLFRNISSIVAERLAATEERVTSIRDEATGSLSMYYLDCQLRLEMQRARRYLEPLSVIAFGVRHSHPTSGSPLTVSDEGVLRAIASTLGRETRKIDLFSRAEDGTFVLLLTRTGLRQAREIAERVSTGMAPDAPTHGGGVSLVAGVSEFREGDDAQVIIERAREALRRALGNNERVAS
jgi:predicted RND superfamily exporter protein/CRP-like cAMP-binding protein